MRVLAVHNYYQQPGGEDIVFESEAELLEANGHEVVRLTFTNESIPEDRGLIQTGRLAASTIWSRTAERRIADAIRRTRPDIAHFHNTFPLVSPSGYAACRKEGVPVVQTLHNYRPLCAKAQFFRDGQVCEECLGRRFTWPGIRHGCYRGSRVMSANVSALQIASRALGSWSRDVSAFIAISEVVRSKYVQGGFPTDALFVKPHFVDPDPGSGDHRGEFALFVGRLSPEKGVSSLLQAWDRLPVEIPLKIVGDGPMSSEVDAAAKRNPLVQWMGGQPLDETMRLIGDASMLVFPSIWPEPFGRTIIESYARGTPVIASELGASRELVIPGVTGAHFAPGDPDSMAQTVASSAANHAHLDELGSRARVEFEKKFTARANYEQLMSIYESAIRTVRS